MGMRTSSVRAGVVALWALAGAMTPISAGGQGLRQGEKALVIKSDRGGVLPKRERELAGLRASGRRVELRGTCISACTMYLSLANACVDPNARFGFHGPSYYGKPLSPEGFERWSQRLASHYREPLRSWFMQVARYELIDYYQISGRQLIDMGYPRC